MCGCTEVCLCERATPSVWSYNVVDYKKFHFYAHCTHTQIVNMRNSWQIASPNKVVLLCELCTGMWQCWRMWKFPSMSKYSQLSRDWELSRKSFGLLVNSSRRSYLQRELSFVSSFLMNALMLCATNAISSPTELAVLRCPSNAAKKASHAVLSRENESERRKWKVESVKNRGWKKRNLYNNFVSANTTKGFRHFSRKKCHNELSSCRGFFLCDVLTSLSRQYEDSSAIEMNFHHSFLHLLLYVMWRKKMFRNWIVTQQQQQQYKK